MNVSILRLARRHPNGVRYWSVPGAPNAAKLVPANRSMWGAPAFFWPFLKGDNWEMRGVRLDWHRTIGRDAALVLVGRTEATQ